MGSMACPCPNPGTMISSKRRPAALRRLVHDTFFIIIIIIMKRWLCVCQRSNSSGEIFALVDYLLSISELSATDVKRVCTPVQS